MSCVFDFYVQNDWFSNLYFPTGKLHCIFWWNFIFDWRKTKSVAPPHDRPRTGLQVLFWSLCTSSIPIGRPRVLARGQGRYNGGWREQGVSTEDKENRPGGDPIGKEEFLPSVGVGFGCFHDYVSINFVNENWKVNVRPSLYKTYLNIFKPMKISM